MPMKLDDEEIERAIRQQIASELLKSLTPECRDAILTKSITAALSEWSFTHAVEGTVAERARELAAEMIKSSYWTEKIAQAVAVGMGSFVARVPAAVEAACVQMVAGKKSTGTYDRNEVGLLLEHLKGAKS